MITTQTFASDTHHRSTPEQPLINTELEDDGKIGDIVKHDNY